MQNDINEYTKAKPYNEVEAKTQQVSRMFNTISGKYDIFNDIMSWGMARAWRRKALSSLKAADPKHILDPCYRDWETVSSGLQSCADISL